MSAAGRQHTSVAANTDAAVAGPSTSGVGAVDRAVHEAVHEMFRNMADCLDGEMEGAAKDFRQCSRF